MFCSKCGKEIPDDSKVCAYCGAQVQVQAESQPYHTTQPNNQQFHAASPNNQPYNGQPNSQQYYNGQPNNQQYYNGQPNNQPYGGYANISLKPDNKFNLAAALFIWIWAMFKGMWDIAIADFVLMFVMTFIAIVIPVVGVILFLIFLLAQFILFGRNANYYYRLKETQGISTLKALRDPNLRRL